MEATMEARRNSLSGFLPFLGPAAIVSVAYMDPGNFAGNTQTGGTYDYSLLWIVLLANVIAMLFQSLSAKLGIVTGQNLAELCRDHFPKPLVHLLWVISEIAATATGVAQLLGGAIGLSVLFHLPLLVGMIVMAIAAYLIWIIEKSEYPPLELVIGGLVGFIGLSYLAELFIASISWSGFVPHLFKFEPPDVKTVTFAAGLLGATIMPHALFLHSGIAQGRACVKLESGQEKRPENSNYEIVAALTVAGLINMAMVIMAAGAFHEGHPVVAKIEAGSHTFAPFLGIAAAGIFLWSLVASGISSSVVGEKTAQVIMQGFIGRQMPSLLRRTIPMILIFTVIALGANAAQVLVMSLVVLSLALPFPMIALVWFTSRAEFMGRYRNRTLIIGVASLCAAGVLLMNAILFLQAVGVSVHGL
ncbi:Nramp family divalent metal transporter [Cupriavidus sp. a3]|uniref:Nramp family divalent metal transporter n=1 Tax=Cupriavidus sp. a3 TaxID=3242158 RepID=UPI003D9C60C5